MESLLFFGLFLIYTCLITALYAVYFIGATAFVLPVLEKIFNDKETGQIIFMTFFWFAAGIIFVLIGLEHVDNIVRWINVPQITNAFKNSGAPV